MNERFAAMGAFAVGDSPQSAGAFLKAELAKWTRVIKTADIKID